MESNKNTDGYTPEQQKTIDEINHLDHYEMCQLWRFGHPYYFTPPYGEIFKERLFTNFGGFTPSNGCHKIIKYRIIREKRGLNAKKTYSS
jgi:hypothetical protein